MLNSCKEFAEQWRICGQKLTPAEKNTSQKTARKKLAKETLLAFTQHTRPNYQVNWHHEHLATMLDRIATGQCRRLMVFMPPQHGKSELVSRRFPAYMLGRSPNLRLIAASHTQELAIAMNRDVQRIIDS